EHAARDVTARSADDSRWRGRRRRKAATCDLDRVTGIRSLDAADVEIRRYRRVVPVVHREADLVRARSGDVEAHRQPRRPAVAAQDERIRRGAREIGATAAVAGQTDERLRPVAGEREDRAVIPRYPVLGTVRPRERVRARIEVE